MKNIVVILDMTNDCNFRCEYCYLSAGEKKDEIDFETAMYAVEKIYNKYKCVVNILFHGGEPLYYFKTIKKVVEELNQKEYANYLRYSIQTNGYLVNDEVVNFFVQYDFSVGVSIDGYDNNGNAARKDSAGSFTTDRVKENMKLLLSKKCSISILSVINKYNHDTIGDEIDRFYKMGVNSFTINPFIPAGRGKQTKLGVSTQEMFETYKTIVEKIIKYKEKGFIICEKNILFMLNKIITGRSGYMCMTTPCGAGLAQYTIDPNGNVYPCADFSGIEAFNLGNVRSDFFNTMMTNEQWIKIRRSRLENFEKCYNCPVIKQCTAGCSVRAYFNNGDVDSVDPICEINKLLIPYLMQPKVLDKIKFLGEEIIC